MKNNLSESAMKVLSALIEVVAPRSDDFNPDLTDHIKKFIDTFVGYFPIHMKLLFPLGLYLLEFGSYIFTRQFKRFSKMDLSERENYMLDWTNSKIQLRRELIRGVRGLVMVAFYSHPIVMDRIGYTLEDHIKECVAKEFN